METALLCMVELRLGHHAVDLVEQVVCLGTSLICTVGLRQPVPEDPVELGQEAWNFPDQYGGIATLNSSCRTPCIAALGTSLISTVGLRPSFSSVVTRRHGSLLELP